MNNIEIDFNGSGNAFSFPGNSEIPILPGSIAMSPQNNNLIYLFDPLYYKGYAINPLLGEDAEVERAFCKLNNIFDDKNNIIPPTAYVKSQGKILNKTDDPNNLIRKGGISGAFFSYEKFNDNSDVPIGFYSYIKKSQAYGVKERTNALLELTDPKENTFNFLQENTYKTFSCFIKLKGPVTHRSDTVNNKIIREKKGIFLNTKDFAIGYRSPHYLGKNSQYILNYNRAYQYKFEPFSFVFSLKDRAKNHTLMTDFLFEFNKTYHLVITMECGQREPKNYDLAPTRVSVYVNGNLMNIAKLDFNPLIRGSPGNPGSRSSSSRNQISPTRPGFKRINGSICYSYQNPIFDCKIPADVPLTEIKKLYIGKSNVKFKNKRYSINPANSGGASKRFLNNLDVGVIHIYKSVLSQNEIIQLYNNFINRYE